MEEFLELIEGTFSNKYQAQCHPTRYAHIWITYKPMGNNRYYGEQAYNYMRKRPYLQYVIEVVLEDGFVRTKNHELLGNLDKYAGGDKLDEITEDDLKYRPGCDLLFQKMPDGSFKGGTTGCECFVEWDGKQTYLQNDITLTEEMLKVMDIGKAVDTGQKIWGSNYGHLEFRRQKDEPS
tara:strand:- start:37 stop:573 length:537 start_codon:yes stop_codon:yes gene_type:complete